ncbi:hypothetical protein L207DRAFT_581587 [Hyaloscypha variabilis F]|uniref:Uncharacterized protein n=1 Tax=Hyaloscypha variabilis (strain UAMH 11265 / GT02V1 / F) TaxID=1149755 RepID=A0A2J6RRJ5_HYAVF|nr:hypothetical protein L207DRAFT_581587 [Hyaloscypha variabilis F]
MANREKLTDLDAIGTRKLLPSNLGGQIIPFLQQKNWYNGNRVAGKNPAIYPLYDINERPGTGLELWIGTNATVWRIMQPSLLIATKMFESTRVQTFFRGAQNYKNMLQSLHHKQRPGNEQDGMRNKVFNILEKMWTLGFKNERQDPRIVHEAAATSARADAYTECDLDRNNCVLRIWTWLDYEIITPLLKDDLDDSVRFGLQYWIATTIVHESMHAIWHVVSMLESFRKEGVYKPANWEPFIESDPISEIGFQMEYGAFGGIIQPMRKRKPFPSFGYWFDMQLPTTNDYARRSPGSALLLEPPVLSPSTYTFPVPIAVFEDAHQNEFWNVSVRQFGTTILQFRRMPTGAVSKWKLNDPNSTARVPLNLYPLEGELIGYVTTLSPEEREAGKRALQRAEQIVAISKTVRDYWLFNNELKTQIDTIIQTLETAEKLMNEIKGYGTESTQGQQAMNKAIELFEKQLDLLERARDTHVTRVNTLLKLELQTQAMNQSQQQFPGPRIGLLEFNAHIRQFARKFRQRLLDMSATGVSPQTKLRLDYVDLHLEISRLKLCNPLDPKFGETYGGKEIAMLIQASSAVLPGDRVPLRSYARTNYDTNDPKYTHNILTN